MARKRNQENYQKVLSYIQAYTDDFGYAPSIRDICTGCGIASTSTVSMILKTLSDEGALVYDGGKSRSIRVTEKKAKVCAVPLIGQIAGGPPILAQQELEDIIPLPESRFGAEGMFALTVRGNSMKNIGIFDGDMVIVKPASTADNGDIVVALIDDEATVKRFYKENGHYRLQPENEAMDPIITDHVEIQGIVTDVIHHLSKQGRI